MDRRQAGGSSSTFDLRDRFERSTATVDLGEWARCFEGAGARYVVMVTRHLDGFPMWPTKIPNPHVPDDYRPSVLWNDMGWPGESDPHQLFVHYYDTVPDGVVNDRWTQVRPPANRLVRELYLRFVSLTLKVMARAGKPLPQRPQRVHSDFHAHEYATPDPPPTGAWELTRGLGRSFGYNARETAADTLTGPQLIHLLADVVAHGGNLLINVGPDGAGHIPDLQQRPLRELGAWLARNGDAIYATRPWSTAATTTADGHQVRYTSKDGTVFAIVLADDLTDDLTIRGLTLPQPAGSACPCPGSQHLLTPPAGATTSASGQRSEPVDGPRWVR